MLCPAGNSSSITKRHGAVHGRYRTAALSPTLLLPYHPKLDPNGVTIIILIRLILNHQVLADVYIGNHGIWKGDERQLIKDLRILHGIAN